MARVAVAQLSCEANTFSSFACDLETVHATGYVLEGEDVLRLGGSSTEVAGILTGLEEDGCEPVPLLAARWNSSAVVTADAYRELRSRLLDLLRAAGPLDGVVVSCHGSMVAEGEHDPEGDLAEAIRSVVGPATPIAMTLDLHGNVTDRMLRALDLVVAYETYPHVDADRTGYRAARLLARTIRGEIRPVTAFARLPMLLTAFHAATTGDSPFAALMREAKALEREPGVLSTSLSFVGSYIDVPGLGCGALVVVDRDERLARRLAEGLARAYWGRRGEFLVDTVGVEEAVAGARGVAGGPIVLLDTADTTGGGAAGDTIGLVRGLLEAGVTERALAMAVDPGAADACAEAGVGSTVELDVGHRVDPRWGEPLRLRGEVIRLSDGAFTYTGGIFGGTRASMGPSAVLRVGSIDLLVQSRATYDFADEQYRSVGLDPGAAKLVGAKNMMNFRNAYGSIMKAAYVLDLPGPTPPDMRALPFEHRPVPCFPWEDPFEAPIVLVG